MPSLNYGRQHPMAMVSGNYNGTNKFNGTTPSSSTSSSSSKQQFAHNNSNNNELYNDEVMNAGSGASTSEANNNNCNSSSSLTMSRSTSAMSMNNTSDNNKQFLRPQLPIDYYRGQLTDILQKLGKTAIFIGETACGKSTQIPQLCLQMPWAQEGLIAVTEPRRVAAKTLAERVAQERGSNAGEEVGYRFRFENKTSKDSRLVYMTEGILLRELFHDYRLTTYSAVIVDEVHERSVDSDVLLFVLRTAQEERLQRGDQPLRVILMSATLDARHLSNYFNGATVYYVKGRVHKVKLFHCPDLRLADNDYLFNAISTVLELHDEEPIESGFLVFLTGQEEIDTAVSVFRKLRASQSDKGAETICPIPLYSAVPTTIAARAFGPAPKGERKVVFATNIAETSVTIPGIDVVIDSGKVKRRTFTAQNRMDVLRVENISKAQAIQRAGRAGREAPGKCYRLYSKQDYESFPEEHVPELQRCNLASVMLELIEIGVQKVASFTKLLSPPDIHQIRAAVDELLALCAIDLSDNGALQITAEGKRLLAFPVHPSHAKILLAASELGCLEEACTVVSFLSSDPVFQFVSHDLFCLTDKRRVGQEEGPSAGTHIKFGTNDGDHARLVSIYRAFTSVKRTNKLKEFCDSNNLNQKRLDQVWQVRKQLHAECLKQKLQFSTAANNSEALKKAICQGLFLNACLWDNSAQCYLLERDRQVRVRIHPSSCLHSQRPSAFVFTELVQTNEVYARDICPVQPEWVRDACAVLRSNAQLAERVRNIQLTPLVRASPCPSTASSSSSSSMKKRRRRRKKKEAEAVAPSTKLLVVYSSSGSSDASEAENGGAEQQPQRRKNKKGQKDDENDEEKDDDEDGE